MSLVDISLAVLYTLVFPGFLFTALVGLLLTWVDRKVTAVIQSRMGPPWFQPFADIGKLLSKRMIVPKGVRTVGFVGAPLFSIAGATLASVIVFLALFNPSGGFMGDLIVLVYLSTMPAIALIIGGASSRSPFGAIGASREMSMVLAYEVGFLLAIITVIVQTSSIRFSEILAYQATNGSVLWSLSGFIAATVMILCLQAKLGFLPFDISEAETELIGGPLAEYSGVGLALFKLSRAMMFFFMPVFLVLIFTGAPQLGLLSILGFLVKLLIVLVLLILIKITHARLRLDQALHFFWTKVALAGLVAVVFALLGLL
jgi:NADH-quinone oxidoreductase subunit H